MTENGPIHLLLRCSDCGRVQEWRGHGNGELHDAAHTAGWRERTGRWSCPQCWATFQRAAGVGRMIAAAWSFREGGLN